MKRHAAEYNLAACYSRVRTGCVRAAPPAARLLTAKWFENEFLYLPTEADWLPLYLHELSIFLHGRHWIRSQTCEIHLWNDPARKDSHPSREGFPPPDLLEAAK